MSFIKIENYTKKLNTHIVLNNINYSFEKGKIYGLSGKNGSGKTMLIRAICGLLTPTDGEILVDGISVGNGIYPKSIGLLIENVTLFEGMSAFNNLKMLNSVSRNKISDGDIKKWLSRFSLNPNDKRAMKKYSLGMCQKVNLIQAFMNYPELIILDEPTNALDEPSVKLLNQIILEINNEFNTTFIIASHDKESLNSVCNKIIEMRDGKIVN